jgi:pimeloyl-ACP methyl ester carboxylesterase
VVAGWRAHSVRVMKAGGLMKRLAISRIAARRRWSWPSAEAAWQHFAAKAAFARWNPEVLRDYIACGVEPDPDSAPEGGVRLAFRREIESQIYSSIPHNLGRLLRRHPPHCPVAYIGGTRSLEARQAGLAATKALAHGRIAWIEGSHLFPMERPAEAAAAVLEMLAAVAAGN